MALEEFRIILNATIGTEGINTVKSQISQLGKNNKIKISLDTSNVDTATQRISNDIKQISKQASNISFNFNNGKNSYTNKVNNILDDYNKLKEKSANVTTNVNKLQTALSSLGTVVKGNDASKITTSYETFNRQLKTTEGLIYNATKAERQLNSEQTLLFSKNNFTNEINTWLRQNESVSQELKDKIRDIGIELQNCDKQKLTQLKTEFSNLKKQADQLSKISDISFNFNNGKSSYTNKVNNILNDYNKLKEKSAEVTVNVDKLQTAFNSLGTAIKSNDTSKITTSYETFNRQLQTTEGLINNATKAEKQLNSEQALLFSKNNFTNEINTWLKQNTNTAQEFKDKIISVRTEAQNCDKQRLTQLRTEFLSLKKQAQQAAISTKSFTQRLKEQLMSLSVYYSATSIIIRLTNMLRSMYQEVLKVNTAMTELYRVTDLTDKQYGNLYDKMITSAKKYGAELDSIISSTASWIRLGFDENTANKLAEITTMYQHVTDLDESTAVENLVTAYKGYQDKLLELYDGNESKAVESIADIFDALGNKLPVTASQVGSGLTKFAAIANTAGASIEEASAMITGGGAVTQDFEAMGNALKVSTLRIHSMKGALEELGEEVDENISSVSKIQTQILNLTHGKVNIFEDDGETFRNIYNIYADIAKILPTLNDTESSELLELLAGKNRSNQILSMLNNWQEVEKAVEVATNAEGTASKEQDKYMTQMQGHLSQLKAQWQSLANELLDSDFLINLIGSGTSALEVIEKIVKALGSIPVAIGAITGIVSSASGTSIIGKDFFQAITNKDNFTLDKDFSKELDNDVKALQAYENQIKQCSSASEKQSVELGYCTAKAQEYSKAIKLGEVTTQDFSLSQKISQVSIQAQQKDLKTCSTIIKEYNDKTKNVGIPQKDFAEAVNKSNSILGTYLLGLGNAKASLGGYITSLAIAQVKTMALQAASMALNMAISMGVSLAVTKLIQGLTYLVNIQTEVAKKSKEELADALSVVDANKEKTQSLNELIEKYKELKRSYDDSGDLDTRNELIDVQTEINKLVDDQSLKLDGVNNNLQTELNLLKEIGNQQRTNNLDDSIVAINTANKAAEKAVGQFRFGHETNNIGDLNKNPNLLESVDKEWKGLFSILSDADWLDLSAWSIKESFKEKGIDTENLIGKIQALEVIKNQLYKSNLENTDLFNDIVNQLNEYNKLADDVKSATNAYVDAESAVLANSGKLSGMTVDSVESFNEYFGALEHELVINNSNISDAIKNGYITQEELYNYILNYMSTTSGISDYYKDWTISDYYKAWFPNSKQVENEVKEVTKAQLTVAESWSKYDEIMNDSDDDGFINKVTKYQEELNSLNDILDNLNKNDDLSKSEKLELVEKYPRLNSVINDTSLLSKEIESLIDTTNNDLSNELATQIEAVGGSATEAGQALLNYYNIIQSKENSDLNFDIDNETEKLSNIYSAISESISSKGLSKSSIANIKDLFSSLNGYDYSKLFEKTANGIHLNREELRKLQNEYVNSKKSEIISQLATLRNRYKEVNASLVTLDKTSEEYNKKLKEKSSIEKEIKDIQELKSEYEGLTSTYEKWNSAKSSGEEYDMWESISNEVETVQSLIDRGWGGAEEVRTFIDLLSSKDLSTAGIDEIIKEWERLHTYIGNSGFTVFDFFTEDEDGNSTIQGIYNFFDTVRSVLGEQFVSIQNGGYVFDFSTVGDEWVAEQLGIDVELLQSILRAASTGGFTVHLETDKNESEETDVEKEVSTLNDLSVNVTETTKNVGKDITKSLDDVEIDIENGTNQIVSAINNSSDNTTNALVSTNGAIRGLSDAINSSNVGANSAKAGLNIALSSVRGGNGSSFANGNVSLAGELGEEILVRNGKFYTLGKNSAEFFNYQKDDIIFNAEQTRQLLSNGKISKGAKRGKSYASGNAFSYGNGTIYYHQNKIPTVQEIEEEANINYDPVYTANEVESAVKDTEKSIDRVAILIDRIQRAVAKLEKQVSNTYTLWTDRNTSLTNEISKVSEEIDIQTAAAKRYTEEANKQISKYGLDLDWIEKLKTGNLGFAYLTNLDDLYEGYQEFKNWYEKMLDCQEAAEELSITLSELYETAFNNVVKEYDDILSLIDNDNNLLEELANQSEARGHILTANYYQELQANERKRISELEKESNDLYKSLKQALNSGTIQEGSEAWHSMISEIDDVNLAIQKANTSLLEYNNSIRQISWDIFDKLQEGYKNVANESDFLISLLSNKTLYTNNGQLTDNGLASMGLHTVDYNVYMAQADKYAQEILNIDKQLANDPYNEDLLDRREELLELQYSSIQAAESEKKAVVDLVKEGIEIELSSLKELIDAYKESLDSQKDLYEYQSKIADKTKEIANLQKQLSAYEGDTSEENRARIQRLKVDLEKAQTDLNDTEYDKYISDQKDLLDNLYDKYEGLLNTRLDNIDLLVSDMIDVVNSNDKSIIQAIKDVSSSVGYSVSEGIQSIFNGNQNSVSTYADKFYNTTVTTLLGSIDSNLQLMLKNLTNDASFFRTSYYTKDKSKLDLETIYGLMHYYDIDTSSENMRKYYRAMGYTDIYKSSVEQNESMIAWMKAHGYASGKYRLNSNELAWTQENGLEAIIRPSDGAILTPLHRGDSILNKNATDNLFNFANNPNGFMSDTLNSYSLAKNMPNISGNNTYNNDVKLTITLPNVLNYNDFVSNLQRDNKFEKMIQSMTLGQSIGKSSLRKYHDI